MPDKNDSPVGKIPFRGRLKLLRESIVYVKPEKDDIFRYRDILYFTRYLLPLKKAIAASLILTMLSSLLSAALPLSGKFIIDYVFLKESVQSVMDKINAFHLGFLGSFLETALPSLQYLIGALLISYVAVYFISNELLLINYRINTEYEYRIKMDVFSRVLKYPLSYFKSMRSGYLMARIYGDTGNLNSVSSGFLQGIVTSGSTLIVSFGILTALSFRLTFFVILSVPLTVLLSYSIIRFNRSYTIRMRESGYQIAADRQDMISSIDLIKMHSAEEREMAKIAKSYRDNIALSIASMLFGQVTSGIQRVITSGVRLFVMLYGGFLVLDKKMTIGDYTAFLAMYPQLTGAITNFLQMPLSWQHTAISASRVKELLNLTTEYEHDDPNRKLIIPDVKPHGEIRCDNVCFSYEKGTPVLEDVTLHIKPGERIGIIGTTGAGKTTFINLLLKFYKPQSGSIYIDHHDLSDLNPGWVREQVGLVSQELMLFHDTIFNNILYSKPGAAAEEVWQAAESAGVHQEILAFPQGYDTIVGERGSKLSGGQKQRIAIARAFLRNAPIIILDEPTAHLDLETEKRFMEECLRICTGRTLILITHRDSLLGLTDRVYEIRNNRMCQR